MSEVAMDVWHVRHVDWLRHLTTAQREELRRAASFREYPAGEMIFAPTPNPHSIFLLERGQVRIFRLSDSGAEVTLGYVAPGEVFGELTAFGDFPRESFAQPVRASAVWRIPREVFQRVIRSGPDIAVAVGKQIGGRLKRIESRVEHLVFQDVRSRVAHILLELAEDFGSAEGGILSIDVPLTQSELATLVGATRQTVNGSLRDLERQGLIGRQKRRVALLKPEELRRLARAPREAEDAPERTGGQEEP